MNKQDVANKIKKDLIVLEGKLLNHNAFKLESKKTNNEINYGDNDVRALTYTYSNILETLRLGEDKEDVLYYTQRKKSIDEIYEKIRIRSEYLLNLKDTSYYKKMMDAFDNMIKIYDIYESKIRRVENIIFQNK